MKFRKKPVVIEAHQFNGPSSFEKMPSDFVHAIFPDTGTGEFKIATLEGEHIVSLGDWVIKGIKGEFYPCKPDIFDATYEAAE